VARDRDRGTASRAARRRPSSGSASVAVCPSASPAVCPTHAPRVHVSRGERAIQSSGLRARGSTLHARGSPRQRLRCGTCEPRARSSPVRVTPSSNAREPGPLDAPGRRRHGWPARRCSSATGRRTHVPPLAPDFTRPGARRAGPSRPDRATHPALSPSSSPPATSIGALGARHDSRGCPLREAARSPKRAGAGCPEPARGISRAWRGRVGGASRPAGAGTSSSLPSGPTRLTISGRRRRVPLHRQCGQAGRPGTQARTGDQRRSCGVGRRAAAAARARRTLDVPSPRS
jgi:hypothetical protein